MTRQNILELSTYNLQCFWDKVEEEQGWRSAVNEIFDMVVEDRDIRGKVWRDYLLADLAIDLGYVIIPLIIELINMFMKIFINISGRLIKFENKTFEEWVIFLLEFILTFFDSTVLILLINASFEGTGIPIKFFDGSYSDFTGEWYAHIAPIFLLSMFLKMVIPIVKFISLYFIKKLKILFDKRGSWWSFIKGTSKDEVKIIKADNTNIFTSKVHNYEYADLHSGSSFKISSPFAKVMCMIFMSLMFGLSLPIMFPCTLIFIIVLYCFNKILVVYWFVKPPQFDDTLAKIFISWIKYGALLFCGFSYWLLTNRQMFDNHVLPIRYQQDVDIMEHSISDIQLNQTLILFIGFFLLIIYLVLYDSFHDAFGIFSERSINKHDKTAEDLHNFYHSLSNKNLIDMIEEEKCIREKYAKKKLFDSTYENLIKEYELRLKGKDMVDSKILYDIPSYQFLAQPEYCEEVGYIPLSKRNQSRFNQKQSDIIDNCKRVFDYPYLDSYNSIKQKLFLSS